MKHPKIFGGEISNVLMFSYKEMGIGNSWQNPRDHNWTCFHNGDFPWPAPRMKNYLQGKDRK
jgi:hypothetical protein